MGEKTIRRKGDEEKLNKNFLTLHLPAPILKIAL